MLAIAPFKAENTLLVMSGEVGHLKCFFLLIWHWHCLWVNALPALPQTAAGAGEVMDGFKGYCCDCNLTTNPDLKVIFAEAIYELRWHGVAKGCRHQSYFRVFDMFYPLAISENVLQDLSWGTMTNNYRRDKDFWMFSLADAFQKVLCCRNWVFGLLNWGSRK